MTEMTIKNAAKINLALDVTGVLPNGYHSIESVFQTVGIYDEITISLTDSGISVSCDVPDKLSASDKIPCDERNIAYKAANLFFEEAQLDCGCSIHILKNIPSQAGMGGGSSDGAAVLFMLNKLTDSGFSVEKLAEIGVKLGADVPFFLTGGTAYVSGIGEKISPISDYSGRHLVIAKGIGGVSTAEAYRNIDSLVNPFHPKVHELINAINLNSENEYLLFGNIFESAVKLDSIREIKSIMNKFGALSSVMTGSGSAIFGLFNNADSAEKCSDFLRVNDFYAKSCLTVKDSFIL